MVEYTKEYLKLNDVEFKVKVKIKDFSTIRIGGFAKIVAYPDTEEKFCNLISFLTKIGLKYKVIGGMSNILADDAGYDGVLIKTDRLKEIVFNEEYVCAMCGVSMPYLAYLCSMANLSGLERLSGIPGRMGGCVRGNAGAYGTDLSECVFECKTFSPLQNTMKTLTLRELDFSYRGSCLKQSGDIIVSVKLKLKKGDYIEIRNNMDYYKSKRRLSQPVDTPSLGSVFKRTSDGISAAKLIDMCELRGCTYGGASISSKHAGFIVNQNNASSEDVKSLVAIAEKSVYDRFSVKLEREIEYLV